MNDASLNICRTKNLQQCRFSNVPSVEEHANCVSGTQRFDYNIPSQPSCRNGRLDGMQHYRFHAGYFRRGPFRFTDRDFFHRHEYFIHDGPFSLNQGCLSDPNRINQTAARLISA